MGLKALATLVALLSLAGCQTGAPPGMETSNSGAVGDQVEIAAVSQGSPTPPLRAIGQEPGWILKLTGEELSLSYQYGEKHFKAPAPTPEPTNPGYRYRASNSQGQQLTLHIRREYCTDVMSGMPYPYSASVSIDQQTLNGCAGDPQTLLTGTRPTGKMWVVEDINGEGVTDNSRITIEFTRDGRVRGSSGCNRYFGRYELSGAGIAVNELAQTRMVCASALMKQENKVLDVIRDASRFARSETGALLLYAEPGQRLKAYHPSENKKPRD